MSTKRLFHSNNNASTGTKLGVDARITELADPRVTELGDPRITET